MATIRLSKDGRERLARFGVGAGLGALCGLLVKELELTSLISYWGAKMPIIVGLAMIFGVLFITRFKWIVGAATIALAGLWLIVILTPIDRWLLPAVVRVDADERAADAIFVFASSLQPDGEPTAVSMPRLFHGIELLGQGRAPRLIVSELAPPHPRYADVARAWMERLQLRGELIAVGPIVNTHDEAVAVARLCRERGWRRVIAVTSPTHARRAAGTLEREGLEVISSPSVETRFDVQQLAGAEDRMSAFGQIAHDALGLWVYRRRGWVAP